jgi:phenylacetate-CoA ligase
VTLSCFWPIERAEIARQRYFVATVELLADRHPWFRRTLKNLRHSGARLTSLQDLSLLPVVTKQDFMKSPNDFILNADGLETEMSSVWDVMYTTGSTTGRPTPFVSTTYDFYNILTLNLNMMAIRGVRDDDVIANLFPLTVRPHGAFARAHQAAAVRNIPVVAALPGNPSPYFDHGNSAEDAVRIVVRSGATILWGVPSFIRRLLQCAAETNADLSRVRMLFVTGEALYPSARADLKRRLQALGAVDPIVSGSYGLTEMQGGLVECREGAGFHNPLPDQFLIEVLDPETHAPLPDGEEGLVTLTHLNRRGTVLLRYAVGDLSVLTREPCPSCGATGERLVAMPRRVDSLVKIKGMLVNPDTVVAALSSLPELAGFRLTVEHRKYGDPLSPDVLRLIVAGDGKHEPDVEALRTLVKRDTGVTPEVDVVPASVLPGSGAQWKSKPFEDLRGNTGRPNTLE